ncbi:tetratricopeptide repeat protein [Yinghuangia aomiensis]
MFAGSAAALAHLKAAAGDADGAVALLLQVAAGQPDRPWGGSAPWLAPGLAARLDPDGFAAAVMQTAQTLDRTLGDPRPAAMGPFAELARAMTAVYPQHGVLLWASSAFMRRLGAFDEAIDWASRAWTLERSLPAAAVLGSAWCRVGREAETVELWTSALRDHPDDVEMHVDLGELLARMGRFDEAEEWIRRGLAIDPAHATAGPAVHGVRWARDHDVAHLVALADHLRAHPDHPYADRLLAGACDGVWLRHVPFPTEAVTKVLPLLLERDSAEDTERVRFDVSALEVPSAVRAVHVRYPQLEVTVQSVREPDMRVPLRPGKYAVWSYPSGATAARPVPGPPVSRGRGRGRGCCGGGVDAPGRRVRPGGAAGRLSAGRPAGCTRPPARSAGSHRGGTCLRARTRGAVAAGRAGVGVPGHRAPPDRRAVGGLGAPRGPGGPRLRPRGLGERRGAVRARGDGGGWCRTFGTTWRNW